MIGSRALAIAPSGQAIVQMQVAGEVPPGFAGTASIASDNPIHIVEFVHSSAGVGADSIGAVSTSASSLVFKNSTLADAGFVQSNIVLHNPGTVGSAVTVTFANQAGVAITSLNVSVPAGRAAPSTSRTCQACPTASTAPASPRVSRYRCRSTTPARSPGRRAALLAADATMQGNGGVAPNWP